MFPAFLFALTLSVACVTSAAAINPGEILVGEMNCIACHSASAEVSQRLDSRQSPILGSNGMRITPQWLMEFLENPAKTKPGTLMPDMLHGLAGGKRKEVIEALTHYLVSIQPPAGLNVGANDTRIEKGRKLYHETGCVQCHAAIDLPKSKENDAEAKSQLDNLVSTPLGNLAKKYTVSDLAAFLANPLKSRPAGRMPGQNLTSVEVEDIAIYLLREQESVGGNAIIGGLQYEYYEGSFPELPVFDRIVPAKTGVTEKVTLEVAGRAMDYALRFRGHITIHDDNFKFYTESDDGSRLLVDDKVIIDNAGVHAAQERGQTTNIPKGTYPFEVQYFNAGGDSKLVARWKGPDLNKHEIPVTAFTHAGVAMEPLGSIAFAVDADKAARGAEFYKSLNCASCHAGALESPGKPPVPELALLSKRSGAGCMSETPTAGLPKFELSKEQRSAIQFTLGSQAVLAAKLTPEQQVNRTMDVLNCRACHVRDERGGADGLRKDYLICSGETDLGDEGRIPPHLNKVGAKLRPEWLREVIGEGTRVRPYMATRMPAFGSANSEKLAASIIAADVPAGLPAEPKVNDPAKLETSKFGLKLLGTGGLSCIACHNFAGKPSLGIPALDLTTLGKRLHYDWFRRYMIDPQSLRPGTRMPGFWMNGVASNKEILDGNTEAQIEAIWTYLSRNDYTNFPDGLQRANIELAAGKNALIYRNFIEGGGSRAIGVAYPEKANLLFDANEVRVAAIWQGSFIDASRHRTGRGEGYEKTMGRNLIKTPSGPAFALLDTPVAPWPTATGKAGGFRFRGYRLDAQLRPTFRYHIGELEIDDCALDLAGKPDPTFRRTIRVKGSPKTTMYFRAAVGRIIVNGDEFMVNEKQRLKFPGSLPVIRGDAENAELLVPFNFNNGEATLVEEIAW